jgi:hypothetical protein
MLEAIGFEGYAGDDVPITFGAAAFREDDQLWNGVTWFAMPTTKWDEYVAEKVVTAITPQKIAVSLKRFAVGYFVLRCSRTSPTFASLVEWFTRSAEYFYAWRDPKWGYWLVAFDVMKPLAAHVLKRASEGPEEFRAAMQKQAYVLDHEKDPNFQAMLAGRSK